jgi:hypothetical protein
MSGYYTCYISLNPTEQQLLLRHIEKLDLKNINGIRMSLSCFLENLVRSVIITEVVPELNGDDVIGSDVLAVYLSSFPLRVGGGSDSEQ